MHFTGRPVRTGVQDSDALRPGGQNCAVLLRSQTQLTWSVAIVIKPFAVFLRPT
jgi:hypothetical protein